MISAFQRIPKSGLYNQTSLNHRAARNLQFGWLACIMALILPYSGAAAESGKPNIVMIFCDDHAFQAISAYGDSRKLIETPNIDRIAKQGMKFNRALVPNSICGPSRACVLTGKDVEIGRLSDGCIW